MKTLPPTRELLARLADCPSDALNALLAAELEDADGEVRVKAVCKLMIAHPTTNRIRET
jgi:hypothetical protein